jgi:hypothetical protein
MNLAPLAVFTVAAVVVLSFPARVGWHLLLWYVIRREGRQGRCLHCGKRKRLPARPRNTDVAR